MLREMRRARQLLSEADTKKILDDTFYGTLAFTGDDDFPCAVPLNFVYLDGFIYFHCAKTGHKIDSLKRCPKVSFTAVSLAENLPEKFTCLYKSAAVFGTAELLDDGAEAYKAITALAKKYSPGESDEAISAEIEKYKAALQIVKINILHMSGKQSIELVR